MPMSHKEQLSKGHRRRRSERRKGSQPRNQTPDSQKGVACFSTFKQVFRFFFPLLEPRRKVVESRGKQNFRAFKQKHHGLSKTMLSFCCFSSGPAGKYRSPTVRDKQNTPGRPKRAAKKSSRPVTHGLRRRRKVVYPNKGRGNNRNTVGSVFFAPAPPKSLHPMARNNKKKLCTPEDDSKQILETNNTRHETKAQEQTKTP